MCADKEYKKYTKDIRIDTWRLCGKKCLEDPDCKVWTFYAGIRGKGKTERECKFYKISHRDCTSNHKDSAYNFRGVGRGNNWNAVTCPAGDLSIPLPYLKHIT